jgi:hypothetical protein
VLARFGKVLVVAALVLTTGLHWAALQTVAWTTMLADHLCQQSFSEAVTQTFDGQHLCPLCRAILAGKKAEKKSAAVASDLKMEFPPMVDKFALIAPTPVSALSLANYSADSSFLKPLLPPPRGLFV